MKINVESDTEEYTSSDLESDSGLVSEKEKQRTVKRQKTKPPSRHFVYDMESMLTSVDRGDGSTSDRHDVVLIVVRQLYVDSEDSDSFRVFRDLTKFLSFALKQKRCYFWAHNAQGYDSQLLFSHITHHCTQFTPKDLILRGGKILQFKVKTTKFRDSMCHLAGALDSLPKMLDLVGNWKKGFFPHRFNTPDNQNYVGRIPDVSYYEPESMKAPRRMEFESWYAEESRKGQQWDLQKELEEYCKSDALVLARGLENMIQG